jgi:phenylacetate-CoA ligase
MPVLGNRLKLIYKMRGEAVSPAIAELKKLEESDRQAVVLYKEKKIEELIDFASENCAYYNTVIGGIKSESKVASSWDLLNALPLTDKWIIKNNFAGFVSSRMRGAWRSTSGTTGTPFFFKKDRFASGYMDAMMYCAYNWHGISPLSRQARIWGSPVGFKSKTIQKAKDQLLGRKRLSAFEMNDHNCKRFFYKLVKHQPFYFYCYPSALYQFALSLEKQNFNGGDIGASIAICTGEVLFSYHRTKIESILNCRVVNEYGSTENGIIGFECEYGNLHLVPTVHVDVVNPDSDGFGELAVTELNSRSVSFIKYKTGDVGRVLGFGCPCQRPYEKIELREGRVGDLIVCPNGDLVYAAVLAYILKSYAIQFKAVQKEKDLINIHIIPAKTYNASSEKKIRSVLSSFLGPEMRINFIRVNFIAPEKSGKLRYFVSRINEKFDGV